MPDQPTRARAPLSDEARFFKSWLGNPKLLGAVLPSGPALAETMAGVVDLSLPGPIVELGPGTGVVTRALLKRGIEPRRLILIEFDPSFSALLETRFPGVRVVNGDAYRLAATLQGKLDSPAAAVISSLPLLMRPEPVRAALLEEAFGLMQDRGAFVQFTYGLASPIRRSPAFIAEGSPRIWRNFPPARVWAYRRPGSAPPIFPGGFFAKLKPQAANGRRADANG
ncbi:MAG TPA: rRNA adenine N-6-methyltransferase family protein [Methylovirgula sp.]|nr:rRNA adenine N-6-methyltransferase family protein [Methylovirgula sp.]